MATPPPAASPGGHVLPQLGGDLFLTDGGLETTLIFQERLDLPYFAAFDVLRRAGGRAILTRYFETYLAIAKMNGTGFILESPTWRASPDWAMRLGLPLATLDALNQEAIALMRHLRSVHEKSDFPIVVSGCVGPRGDGYVPETLMSPENAEDYHGRQIAVFAASGADMITATTMTNVPEAIGIVRAAHEAGLPVVVSFTVETNAHLPTGETLGDAIRAVDEATDNAPAYYMVNCAHPSHFAPALETAGPWALRLRGIRANASRRSHAELDNAATLDSGDPDELAECYRAIVQRHPNINVLGGCCGTDHRHIAAIARAVMRQRGQPAGSAR